jgi:hypothetical protein
VIGDRWGVTEEEMRRHYPCDDFVPSPRLEVWRGVTVRATPADIWPWLTQVRLAPYSYDWIDNLGRRSPQQRLDLPAPTPGDSFTTAAGHQFGQILSVTPEEQLTARIIGVVMSYALVSQGDETRLLLKIAGRTNPLVAPFLSVGDLIMARRQLLNFKALAEATQPARSTAT